MRAVLAHRLSWDRASTIAMHNLGAEPCSVPLELEELPEGMTLVDQLCDGVAHVDESGSVELQLEGYGFRWLRVMTPRDRRLA